MGHQHQEEVFQKLLAQKTELCNELAALDIELEILKGEVCREALYNLASNVENGIEDPGTTTEVLMMAHSLGLQWNSEELQLQTLVMGSSKLTGLRFVKVNCLLKKIDKEEIQREWNLIGEAGDLPFNVSFTAAEKQEAKVHPLHTVIHNLDIKVYQCETELIDWINHCSTEGKLQHFLLGISQCSLLLKTRMTTISHLKQNYSQCFSGSENKQGDGAVLLIHSMDDRKVVFWYLKWKIVVNSMSQEMVHDLEIKPTKRGLQLGQNNGLSLQELQDEIKISGPGQVIRKLLDTIPRSEG